MVPVEFFNRRTQQQFGISVDDTEGEGLPLWKLLPAKDVLLDCRVRGAISDFFPFKGMLPILFRVTSEASFLLASNAAGFGQDEDINYDCDFVICDLR